MLHYFKNVFSEFKMFIPGIDYLEIIEGIAMPDYKYLIIGGGMTADSAVKGIRKIDQAGSIGIISADNYLPYDSPPLTKKLWKGDPFESIWRNTPNENVIFHLARVANSIDPEKKSLIDNLGVNYSYYKLLIATGGTVRNLPFNADGIIYFRTLDDYKKLRALTEHKQNFAVIGGGFIGSEIAAALAMNKKNVTMIFPEVTIGSRVYPEELSQYITNYFREKGVTVLANDGVAAIEKLDSKYMIRTSSGRVLYFDGVVAGIGIQPNVRLAQSAGLTIDNGIVVNEFLQTSQEDIYSAGDVANFYNPALGKRVRLEHEDNANVMGEMAGMNMAGAAAPYNHLPYFYSDLFELAYEAVGELNSNFETVEEWKEKYEEGVVYYLNEGRVRGVLLWNTWDQVDNARKLIAEKGPFNAGNVIGRLPE